MAKMTIEGVTYEGTPAELAGIFKEFMAVGVESKEASEDTTLKAGDKVRLLSGGGKYPLIGFTVGDVYYVNNPEYTHDGNTKVQISGGTHGGGNGYATRDQLEKVTDGSTLTAKVDELDSRVTALEKGDDKPAYKTEKRAAKVGERILITDATQTAGKYSEGDVLTVAEADVPRITGQVGTVYVKEQGRRIYVEEYEVIVEETPAKTAPAKEIEHNGETYTLVSRKAQAGDVVVATKSTSRYVKRNAPHGPAFVSTSGNLCIRDKDGDTVRLYTERLNRTEANVLVYEKKEPALKVGDYVRVKNGADSRHGDIEAGTIVKVTDTDWDPNHPIRVELLDESDFDYFREHGVELVDVEEGKKAAVFAKAGRKMNEFKRGDIVRDKDFGVAVVKEIAPEGFCVYKRGMTTECGNWTYKHHCELIAPVESRVGNVGAGAFA